MPSKQRSSDKVPLQVTKPSDIDSRGSRAPFGALVPPWVTGGVIGALGVGLVGWLLATGWALALWLSEIDGGVGGVLLFGTHIWLAGNGAGLQLGNTTMTVIPLGLTTINAVGLYITSYFSARSARKAVPLDEAASPLRVVAQTATTTLVTYVTLVTLLTVVFGKPAQAGRSLGLSLLVAAVAGVWGAMAATKWQVLDGLPHWVRWGRRAVNTGLGILLLVSITVLITAAASHWDRIAGLSGQLGLGPLPAAVLVLGQLAFLPNMVLWAGSYSLGAGFSLGTGTQVTVTSTSLGLLPAFPVFGALPLPGVTEPGQIAWLLGGVVAGGVAAILAVRWWWQGSGPRTRVELAAVAGLVVGLVTALLWVGLSALSRGDLGASRLVGIGPRLPELIAYSCGLLGVAGALAGAGYALVRARNGEPATEKSGAAAKRSDATVADAAAASPGAHQSPGSPDSSAEETVAMEAPPRSADSPA